MTDPDLLELVAALADSLEAEPAKVAAAYEAAASVQVEGMDYCSPSTKAAIRALTPADAQAALDKMLAEARLSGLDVSANMLSDLEAENQRLREAEKDAVATLNAWFDRRELAHEAIDQAVIDAAAGYLRTSRVGGMPQSESDLVLGVISDMARLSLFADLFARAALRSTETNHDD